MISQKARSFPAHLGQAAFFGSARAGLSAFYRSRAIDGRLRVVLPAYIGWSPKEGSGLFDSVTNDRFDYAFYELDRRGNVRIDSLTAVGESPSPTVLVLVHYFGRPDPLYDDLVKVGTERGWTIVDDCAHAMLTHLCASGLGSGSDAMVFSLHKMLPLDSGGVLLTSAGGISDGLDTRESLDAARHFASYDHASAASHRQRVSIEIHENFEILSGVASPLWEGCDLGAFVPQSYPIIVNEGSQKRNALYERLHSSLGLTTLYHTLVEPLMAEARFADARWLSEHITNLPVHPEVPVESVVPTLTAIREVLDS